MDALLDRDPAIVEPVIVTGNLVVDMTHRIVKIDDVRVHLTPTEYKILKLFSLRKGITLSKSVIFAHLYDEDVKRDPKIIGVFICKLRKKLTTASRGTNYIDTIFLRGYILRDPPAQEATYG